MGFPGGSVINNLPANAGDVIQQVWSLGWEDPLEEGMATHSSILAHRTVWTEEPVKIQSVGHIEYDMCLLTFFTFKFKMLIHWKSTVEGKKYTNKRVVRTKLQ